MRGGFAGDFKKAMQTALYDEFQADIPGTHEVVVERIVLFAENGTNDMEPTNLFGANLLLSIY